MQHEIRFKMKKTSQQLNLLEPPAVLDLFKLLTESDLSENEQGILKRRLIENREQFGKFLQRLLKSAEKEDKILDMPESLKKLEKDEGRQLRSFDSVAKVLAHDFPELLKFILDEYQVEAEKTKTLIGKEFIFVKRIADIIFEAKDKNGKDVIIHLEFEREYDSDEQMDRRKLEYRHLMEMDEDYEGKVVLCNVFYLRGSPEDKNVIEEREVDLPSGDPRYSGKLKYKAYHLSLITIETIVKRNLPFLLPFFVESEFRAINGDSETKTQLTTTGHIVSLREQIDSHEEELTQMIKTLTPAKMDSLRTTVEYLWGKSYSKDIFNQSTLLNLMREQLNFRQSDIQRGRSEGRAEGLAEKQAQITAVARQMAQNGEISKEQMEKFLKYMEEAQVLPRVSPAS